MEGRGMNARRRKPRRGVFGWTWRLLLAVLVWLAGVAAYITWVGQRDDARPADARRQNNKTNKANRRKNKRVKTKTMKGLLTYQYKKKARNKIH